MISKDIFLNSMAPVILSQMVQQVISKHIFLNSMAPLFLRQKVQRVNTMSSQRMFQLSSTQDLKIPKTLRNLKSQQQRGAAL